MAEGQASLNDALSIALCTGKYSDLVIKCGNFERNVHKLILCTQSPVFAKAMEPGLFKEGREGVLELHAVNNDLSLDADVNMGADESEAVKLMIDFLYLHNYFAENVVISKESANAGSDTSTDTESQPLDGFGYSYNKKKKRAAYSVKKPTVLNPAGDCNTVMHAKMYALGHKYGIKSLSSVALDKFAEAATYAWNHSDFIEAIRIVYTSTPDQDKGLRAVTTNVIMQHREILSKKEEFEDCVCDLQHLAFDLWKSGSALQICETDTSRCYSCSEETKIRECVEQSCRAYFIKCSCSNLGRCPACS